MKAFTLVELLIVVAILGILALTAFAVLNPAKRQNQAKDTQIKGDIGQIATALSASYTSLGKSTYPTDLNSLVSSGDLKSLPTPPAGGSYEYVVNPVGCLGTDISACTSSRVSEPLFDPNSSGNLWCWQSSTGKAAELAVAACTAP